MTDHQTKLARLEELPITELDAAARRCEQVEVNSEARDPCWISRVYDRAFNPTLPKGIDWDTDKRLLAKHFRRLLEAAKQGLEAEADERLGQCESELASWKRIAYERGTAWSEANGRIATITAECDAARPSERLIIKWRQLAIDSREEADRIRRTIKSPTGAEERCLVRAELWNKCAEELEHSLSQQEQNK